MRKRLNWGKEERGRTATKHLKGESEVKLHRGEKVTEQDREREREAIVDLVHTEKQRHK